LGALSVGVGLGLSTLGRRSRFATAAPTRDEPRDARQLVEVDVLHLVGELVVVAVAAGGKKP
jgi:hypothetical protein